VALCDRGTVDGVAYWPGPEGEFFRDVGTTREAELERYASVIHLRTPGAANGYNRTNPVRTESATEAAAIDEKILAAWSGHPRRHVVESTEDFFEKVTRALAILQEELPVCDPREGSAPMEFVRSVP
jgi:hypothetical protein